MTTKTLSILPGDGIGPEVMSQTLRVLTQVEKNFGHTFILKEGLVGGAAFDKYSEHFPEITRKLCEDSDAILFGSVGGPITESHLPKWKNCETNSILAIRKHFGFSINFRPCKVYSGLEGLSPLKNKLLAENIDILILRELSGDVYFGEKKRWCENGSRFARDIGDYSEEQIKQIAIAAFEAARYRAKKVCSVDKANVLETSKLWREVVQEVHEDYKEIELSNMLVDNCALQLLKNPAQFDVILTSNLFGDILSDLAAGIPGSLGFIPSASVNSSGFGLYEPSGGSAPDIAGKGIANPIAQILSAAMMLRFSFKMNQEADFIEKGVEAALNAGYRTKDIEQPGCTSVGTVEITDQILERLRT